MKRILHLIGLTIVLSCPMFIQAQTYTTYKDLPEVKIDYTVQQCGAEPNVISELIFLRLTNKTDHNITVRFKIETYYNGACTSCNNSEYLFTYNLSPNASLTTDCNGLSTESGTLAIVKRYVNRSFGHPLDKFELSGITIN